MNSHRLDRSILSTVQSFEHTIDGWHRTELSDSPNGPDRSTFNDSMLLNICSNACPNRIHFKSFEIQSLQTVHYNFRWASAYVLHINASIYSHRFHYLHILNAISSRAFANQMSYSYRERQEEKSTGQIQKHRRHYVNFRIRWAISEP